MPGSLSSLNQVQNSGRKELRLIPGKVLRNLTVLRMTLGEIRSMRRPSRNPVYNARIRSMRIFVAVAWAGCCLVFVLLFVVVASAGDWQAPCSQLAQRIAAITGPGAVAVTIVNRSSLAPTDADDIHRRLLTELAAYGVQPSSTDQAAATVQVTLSENLRDYLWVAEIHQGTSEPVVVMVTVPNPGGGAAVRASTPFAIHKALLWSDENRILDLAVLNSNPPHMIVLEPEQIVLNRLQNGQWLQEQLLPLIHVRPWPRDLRGRLVLRKDHLFDAYLPGVFCRSTAAAPLSVTCEDSDDPWPLTGDSTGLKAFFSAARNFFTGALSPGIQKQTVALPFYSAAPLPRDKYTLWAFAAVDGQVHFLDGVADRTFAQLGWGSGIASLRSGCGPGWQILATSDEDGPADNVKAFEIPDREPILVSPPVEFKGPITALWTDSDSTSVIAISQNSETGKYEAYRLSIDCHQ